MTKHCHRSLLASAILAAFSPAQAQQDPAGEQPATAAATVIVIGSRTAARSALDTVVPVGLIGPKDMQTAGPLEVGKLLQTLDPSFNFSSTFISDGTDIIRPATLRSLGPDQILVLVNGKRRHQQALVNVQQTIGRGSAGTDINAIPMSAIQRIEVLRDGAAAQYGSDAIAGVINIVLKQQTNETQLSGTVGGTSEGGGQLYSGSANKGWTIGDGGYVNLTLEGRHRGETNRAGPDTLRVDPPRVTQRIGDSLAKDKYFWWNTAMPLPTRTRRVLHLRRRVAPHRRCRPASSAPPATAATCPPSIRTASCRTSSPRCKRRLAGGGLPARPGRGHGSWTPASTTAAANSVSTNGTRSTSATGTSRNAAAASTANRRAKPTPAA